MDQQLTSTIHDTALILEGGGMRGAFTAGILSVLLEQGWYFDYVAGISAGSSNTVNYLARSAVRARQSFVDFADHPQFASWRNWVAGRGYFNAAFIYEQAGLPNGPLPLDFATLMANPAQFRIGAFDASAGQTIYWSRPDITDLGSLLRRVRASSTIPWLMPPVTIDGRLYVDGALGAGGGIPLPVAQHDGFTKFFVILTRPRDYLKPAATRGFTRAVWPRYPAIAAGVAARPQRYNAIREELQSLERQGRAVVVCPDQMTITNRTRDVAALRATFEAGQAQARRQLPAWGEFLGLGSSGRRAAL
jgi:predicted patatin/cPLA2 family phospholipase